MSCIRLMKIDIDGHKSGFGSPRPRPPEPSLQWRVWLELPETPPAVLYCVGALACQLLADHTVVKDFKWTLCCGLLFYSPRNPVWSKSAISSGPQSPKIAQFHCYIIYLNIPPLPSLRCGPEWSPMLFV